MKLTIKERLLLSGILPSEGNIVTVRIIRDLMHDLGISEEEKSKYNFVVHPDGNITWNDKYDSETKDVNIGSAAFGIIRDALKQADEKNKLHWEHIPMYEKFVDKDYESISKDK